MRKSYAAPVLLLCACLCFFVTGCARLTSGLSVAAKTDNTDYSSFIAQAEKLGVTYENNRARVNYDSALVKKAVEGYEKLPLEIREGIYITSSNPVVKKTVKDEPLIQPRDLWEMVAQGVNAVDTPLLFDAFESGKYTGTVTHKTSADQDFYLNTYVMSPVFHESEEVREGFMAHARKVLDDRREKGYALSENTPQGYWIDAGGVILKGKAYEKIHVDQTYRIPRVSLIGAHVDSLVYSSGKRWGGTGSLMGRVCIDADIRLDNESARKLSYRGDNLCVLVRTPLNYKGKPEKKPAQNIVTVQALPQGSPVPPSTEFNWLDVDILPSYEKGIDDITYNEKYLFNHKTVEKWFKGEGNG